MARAAFCKWGSRLLLCAVFTGTLAACSPSRLIESGQLLRDIAAKEERQPIPEARAHSFTVGDTLYEADLYSPAEPARAALVLVPGVTPKGKDDPRLVAFARDLARSRFLVLVPEIPNLRELRVSAEDADPIASAVIHISGQQTPVGIVAISYAAGPAMLATLRADLAPVVRFLVLVGPYHDIGAVVRFFTTGYYRRHPEEPWRHLQPNTYGKWVFARSNAHRLRDPRDRDLMLELADRKLGDPDADIGDLVGALGSEGRAVYRLLENRDPERVDALIAALPASIRKDMASLDLSRRDLSAVAADVLLIHGRDDPIIPVTESQALAEALPADRVDLYLIDDLAHVDLGTVGSADLLRLWRAAYRLLEMRDEPQRPSP